MAEEVVDPNKKQKPLTYAGKEVFMKSDHKLFKMF